MAPNRYEKIYTVTSVHHLIPIKLDLAKLNYTHWKKLFTTHCSGFDVLDFIRRESTAEEHADADWIKADSVVSSWIYLTISEPLLERVLNSDPKTAFEAWTFLEKVFQDNKRSKTMELTAELRGLNIGSLSVEDYFRKIDMIATNLRNLGATVEENDLVMHAVNGLNEKFAHASHIIIHRDPFPDLNTVRSMLTMEEMTINRKNRNLDGQLNSSSPTALVVQNSSAPSSTNNAGSSQSCRNFMKGFCRFGDRCRFAHHDSTRRPHNSPGTQQQNNRPNSLNQAQLLNIIAAQQQQLAQSSHSRAPSFGTSAPTQFQAHGFGLPNTRSKLGPTTSAQRGILPTPPGFHSPQPTSFGPQPLGQHSGPQAYFSGPNTFGPSYGSFTVDPQSQTQETVLPSAFNAMTLQDYGAAGWHMDTDEIQAKMDSRTLKILSYNVWFAEDIELRLRMRAIGDIIQLHSPDVICLQEVTSNIYALLQRSNWWKSYKCSLSLDQASTRPYFCMQLSKLPMKSFGCKPFSYSAMGRELCIAEVSARGDTPLVVATSHLESPCRGPPKWDQMYSKERVKQANEAVDFLKRNPNVIFCGDMNWDDKLDGEFPLPDGWIDAWTELKPKEIGWTYDTKANPMLSANRKLQKRLDRFLISLCDFKVECINMVGTKPIPEVTYMKQKKGGKELELPVLPSDHFGLLLTISAR